MCNTLCQHCSPASALYAQTMHSRAKTWHAFTHSSQQEDRSRAMAGLNSFENQPAIWGRTGVHSTASCTASKSPVPGNHLVATGTPCPVPAGNNHALYAAPPSCFGVFAAPQGCIEITLTWPATNAARLQSSALAAPTSNHRWRHVQATAIPFSASHSQPHLCKASSICLCTVNWSW